MNLYKQIKPALDKAILAINDSSKQEDAYILTEQTSPEGDITIFLVSNTAEVNIILSVPLRSNKIEDRTEAYFKIFTVIVKMGLQSMDLITKDAKDKAKIEEAQRKENEEKLELVSTEEEE